MTRILRKDTVIILLILFLATVIRFVYIDAVPNAVGGDELHYVVTAKSVWHSGRDISGTWNPLSLIWFQYPPNEHQAELPYLLHFLFSAAFPFSIILIKMPFVLLSIGIVLLFYVITKPLFGPQVALATAAVASVNPWLVVMGRSAYEATPAMFFYLLALYFVIREKNWNILRAIIPLMLAFYSYIATKVILVPYVLSISLLGYLANGKRYIRQYLVLIVFSVIMALGFYYFTRADTTGSRIGEIILPTSTVVTDTVNQIRQTSLASPFLPLIVNKFTVYFQLILPKLARVFSPAYLFVEGDQVFLPGRQSFFYWLDAMFLVIGTVWMFGSRRQYAWILWLLILIGSIPQLIHSTKGDFSTHVTMVFPFLLPFIGAGIVATISSVPKRFSHWVMTGILVLYAANVANFSVVYFLQYPLVAKNDFPMRILTKYIQLANATQTPIVVYTTSASDVFQKYMLYADVITKTSIPTLASLQGASDVEYNGNRFVSCGKTLSLPSHTTEIYDVGCGKTPEGPHLSITTLVDGGETYKIFNDAVCGNYQLKTYPDQIGLNSFDIERLSEEKFCETFISRR